MKNALIAASFAALAALSTAASAQTVPSPANPFPEHPIATDGSPLPSANAPRTLLRNDFQALYEGQDRSDAAAERR